MESQTGQYITALSKIEHHLKPGSLNEACIHESTEDRSLVEVLDALTLLLLRDPKSDGAATSLLPKISTQTGHLNAFVVYRTNNSGSDKSRVRYVTSSKGLVEHAALYRIYSQNSLGPVIGGQ